MIDPDFLKKLQDVVGKTEGRINHVDGIAKRMQGHVISGLNIPSVNELRYSFVHLLRHLSHLMNSQSDGGKDNEDLKAKAKDEAEKALRHSKRALYDSYEIEAYFHCSTFIQFQNDYRNEVVAEVEPAYLKWAYTFNNLKHFLDTTVRDDRERFCEDLEGKTEEAADITAHLVLTREELNKRRKRDLEATQLAQERWDAEQVRRHSHLKWVKIGSIFAALLFFWEIGSATYNYVVKHEVQSVPTKTTTDKK